MGVFLTEFNAFLLRNGQLAVESEVPMSRLFGYKFCVGYTSSKSRITKESLMSGQIKLFQAFAINTGIVVGLATIEAADTTVQGGRFDWRFVTGAGFAALIKFMHTAFLTLSIERSLVSSSLEPGMPSTPSISASPLLLPSHDVDPKPSS